MKYITILICAAAAAGLSIHRPSSVAGPCSSLATSEEIQRCQLNFSKREDIANYDYEEYEDDDDESSGWRTYLDEWVIQDKLNRDKLEAEEQKQFEEEYAESSWFDEDFDEDTDEDTDESTIVVLSDAFQETVSYYDYEREVERLAATIDSLVIVLDPNASVHVHLWDKLIKSQREAFDRLSAVDTSRWASNPEIAKLKADLETVGEVLPNLEVAEVKQTVVTKVENGYMFSAPS